jgi:uncharacterized membrane protein YkvA (DUF1232 family)
MKQVLQQDNNRWGGWIKRRLAFYQRVLRDPETPRAARWVLGFAVAYLLSPLDLIPDWIPLLGQLDDLILVPLFLCVAMALVPDHAIERCRAEDNASGRG